ncbi:hypothetical protein KAT55_07290 [Candidatus Bathyarchaeota archaeon]|nr:hypothetical protein [Candidatus Bathyarchaeota archaeon]
MQRLRRSPYMLFVMGLAASLMVIILDFAVDFFLLYKDKGFNKVLMINLRPTSLWTDLLIVVSYLGFSYVLFRLQRDSAEEQKTVDGFLYKLLDSFKSLRYNLYSMKMAIHVARHKMEPPTEMLSLIDQGIERSVGLINGYLALTGDAQDEE